MKTTVFDAAAYLETDEDIAAYMTEALATGNAALIATPSVSLPERGQ